MFRSTLLTAVLWLVLVALMSPTAANPESITITDSTTYENHQFEYGGFVTVDIGSAATPKTVTFRNTTISRLVLKKMDKTRVELYYCIVTQVQLTAGSRWNGASFHMENSRLIDQNNHPAFLQMGNADFNGVDGDETFTLVNNYIGSWVPLPIIIKFKLVNITGNIFLGQLSFKSLRSRIHLEGNRFHHPTKFYDAAVKVLELRQSTLTVLKTNVWESRGNEMALLRFADSAGDIADSNVTVEDNTVAVTSIPARAAGTAPYYAIAMAQSSGIQLLLINNAFTVTSSWNCRGFGSVSPEATSLDSFQMTARGNTWAAACKYVELYHFGRIGIHSSVALLDDTLSDPYHSAVPARLIVFEDSSYVYQHVDVLVQGWKVNVTLDPTEQTNNVMYFLYMDQATFGAGSNLTLARNDYSLHMPSRSRKILLVGLTKSTPMAAGATFNVLWCNVTLRRAGELASGKMIGEFLMEPGVTMNLEYNIASGTLINSNSGVQGTTGPFTNVTILCNQEDKKLPRFWDEPRFDMRYCPGERCNYRYSHFDYCPGLGDLPPVIDPQDGTEVILKDQTLAALQTIRLYDNAVLRLGPNLQASTLSVDLNGTATNVSIIVDGVTIENLMIGGMLDGGELVVTNSTLTPQIYNRLKHPATVTSQDGFVNMKRILFEDVVFRSGPGLGGLTHVSSNDFIHVVGPDGMVFRNVTASGGTRINVCRECRTTIVDSTFNSTSDRTALTLQGYATKLHDVDILRTTLTSTARALSANNFKGNVSVRHCTMRRDEEVGPASHPLTILVVLEAEHSTIEDSSLTLAGAGDAMGVFMLGGKTRNLIQRCAIDAAGRRHRKGGDLDPVTYETALSAPAFRLKTAADSRIINTTIALGHVLHNYLAALSKSVVMENVDISASIANRTVLFNVFLHNVGLNANHTNVNIELDTTGASVVPALTTRASGALAGIVRLTNVKAVGVGSLVHEGFFSSRLPYHLIAEDVFLIPPANPTLQVPEPVTVWQYPTRTLQDGTNFTFARCIRFNHTWLTADAVDSFIIVNHTDASGLANTDPDTGPDASADSDSDTCSNPGAHARPDAGSDARPDTGSDAGSDSSSNAEPHTRAHAGAHACSHSEPHTRAHACSDAAANPSPHTRAHAGAHTAAGRPDVLSDGGTDARSSHTGAHACPHA